MMCMPDLSLLHIVKLVTVMSYDVKFVFLFEEPLHIVNFNFSVATDFCVLASPLTESIENTSSFFICTESLLQPSCLC